MAEVADKLDELPADLPENLPADAPVFVAAVRKLGPPPAGWSGRFAMYQEIELDVSPVLRGELPRQVAVDLAVVKGSPLARADEPGLSPEVLSAGSRWIVAVVEDEKRKRWRVAFITPWSKEREAKAKEHIAGKKS